MRKCYTSDRSTFQNQKIILSETLDFTDNVFLTSQDC